VSLSGEEIFFSGAGLLPHRMTPGTLLPGLYRKVPKLVEEEDKGAQFLPLAFFLYRKESRGQSGVRVLPPRKVGPRTTTPPPPPQTSLPTALGQWEPGLLFPGPPPSIESNSPPGLPRSSSASLKGLAEEQRVYTRNNGDFGQLRPLNPTHTFLGYFFLAYLCVCVWDSDSDRLLPTHADSYRLLPTPTDSYRLPLAQADSGRVDLLTHTPPGTISGVSTSLHHVHFLVHCAHFWSPEAGPLSV